MQVNNMYRQVQPHRCCLLPNTHKTKSFVIIINLDNINNAMGGIEEDWEARGAHVPPPSVGPLVSRPGSGRLTVSWDGSLSLLA